MRLFLQRYLLEEIIAPFVVGVMMILVMLLGDHLYKLLDLVIVKGVGLLTVARILLLIMPEMMVIAFPLATMLAVSLGVNRLVRENEWSSMRLGGMSLQRMLVPVIVFGAGVGCLAWLISEHLAPAAKQEYVRATTRLALANPTVVIQPKKWFQPPTNDRWFFVNSVDPRTGVMRNLVIFSELQSDYPTALMAQEGRLVGERFVLKKVVRHMWRSDGTLERESETDEVEMRFSKLVPQVIGLGQTAGEMSSGQLKALIRQQGKQGIRRPDQVIDLHRKYAAPVACLVLALMCVPLNVLTAHRGSFFGLLITAILVVIYFLTLKLGESLARDGFLRQVPVLGVWLQTIVFGLLTAGLLRRCR